MPPDGFGSNFSGAEFCLPPIGGHLVCIVFTSLKGSHLPYSRFLIEDGAIAPWIKTVFENRGIALCFWAADAIA